MFAPLRRLPDLPVSFRPLPVLAAWVFFGPQASALQHAYVELRPEPVLVAQQAVPVPREALPEKALLNDFSFREPEEALQLDQEGERQAEALARYAEGLRFEEMAELEKAAEQYLQVLEFDPGFTDLAIKVAFEFVRRGDIPRGIEILKDAAKENPSEALLQLNLASIYARELKKFDLAIRHAREALKAAPDNPIAHQTLYEIYLAAGQTTNAERALEQAARLDVEDPEFWLRLGDLYARSLIKEDGSTKPDDLKKVNAVFQKALDRWNGDSMVLNRAADYFVFSDQIKEAIPLYVRILELRDKVAAPLLSNVREKLARSLLISGQREEAISVLEEMVRANPLKYETYEFLGQLHEENGNLERALVNYEQSLLLSPNQPVNYLRVADVQLRLGAAGRAITTLEEARERFPDIPLLTYTLAVSYSQAGRHDDAMRAFEETLHEAQHSQEEVVNGHFYFNYGAAAEQAGLRTKAAEMFKKSIEIDPIAAAPAMNYLGYMWAERGENLEEAEQLISRALELEPDNGAYIDSLGWLYFQQGKYELALRELLRAAEHLETPDAVVFDHIADAYLKLESTEQALEYYRQALALDPENEELAAKLNRAKELLAASPQPE